MYSGIIAVYMRDVTQKHKENSSFLIHIKYVYQRKIKHLARTLCRH